MRAFFLKSYLAVIAFSMAMLALIVFVIFKPMLIKNDWEDFTEELVVDHQLLMLKLNQTPPDLWEQVVRDYQPVFGMVPTLVAKQSLKDTEAIALAGGKSKQLLSSFSVDIWYGLFVLPDSNYVLKISEDGSPIDDIKEGNIFWLALPLILIALSQAFGMILIIRHIAKPIRQLTTSVKEFGKGHYQERIATSKPPVEQLALSFNAMADEIETKIHEQQILVGAIPHELRTPLSRIRFALDLSRDKSNLADIRSQIEIIDQHVDDLDNIVESVLELTKMISGELIAVPIDIQSLLASVLENYADPRINIALNCPDHLSADGHERLIQQSINNLVQNAILFAGSAVHISAFTDAGDIVIRVDDDGAGVAPEKLEEIFLPFSRLDKSRNQATGGLGLGLAFVKLIMAQHHGQAIASNLQPHGLRGELRWPLKQA